jgi:hypothetical protein
MQDLEKGHETIENFNNYEEDFYDTCTEYIQERCLPFLMPLQRVDWISLKGKVTWKRVQVNYVFMKTVVPDLSLNEDHLFDGFSCVQKYCESKLEVWNEKNDQNVTEKVKLSLCLTNYALRHEGVWSASHPGRFTPGERAPSIHWIGG